jgi:glycosyltransferase involved in cell wall biosynthesis
LKKISIVGTVGLPAKYGGFETLVNFLTQYLNTEFELTIFCSSKSYEEKKLRHNGARLKYVNLSANGSQSIPYDIISIIRSLLFADTLLILGVSGCIVLPLVRIFSKKRIIINIDGLEWRREKWGRLVKGFLKFSERLAVRFADVVVCDNQKILEYVKEEYGCDGMLITYGADHVLSIEQSESVLTKYPFLKNDYAFKVCRIEPENNVHVILEAFQAHKGLPLIIIGNWHRSEYGKGLKEKYRFSENIHLLDPIYDPQILEQFRSNCYLYIHGHSAGGTNPSLVEAMYLGLPILAYDVGYNRVTTKEKALYFKTSCELREILTSVTSEKRDEIKIEMKDIAVAEYNWNKISIQYAELF